MVLVCVFYVTAAAPDPLDGGGKKKKWNVPVHAREKVAAAC